MADGRLPDRDVVELHVNLETQVGVAMELRSGFLVNAVVSKHEYIVMQYVKGAITRAEAERALDRPISMAVLTRVEGLMPAVGNLWATTNVGLPGYY